jgi:cytidylate kinase
MVETSANPEDPVLDVVAIDGPSGAGKSSVARRLATLLDFSYLDTGALYRAVTWHLLRSGFRDLGFQPAGKPSSPDHLGLLELLDRMNLEFTEEGRTLLNGLDVTVHLRSLEVESRVSWVSARSEVRSRMRDLQRQIARSGPLVAEGRDMGSVVFPNARWKFFLDASPEERARRRQQDFAASGRTVSLAEVHEELQARDRLDTTRQDAPLIQAPDAIRLNSTDLTVDQVVDCMMEAVDRESS